jgi:hypothetical protein
LPTWKNQAPHTPLDRERTFLQTSPIQNEGKYPIKNHEDVGELIFASHGLVLSNENEMLNF